MAFHFISQQPLVSLSALIVGGGGTGGGSNTGFGSTGNGGLGGTVLLTSFNIRPNPGTTFPITVGAGGVLTISSDMQSTTAQNGFSSIFNNITAAGGTGNFTSGNGVNGLSSTIIGTLAYYGGGGGGGRSDGSGSVGVYDNPGGSGGGGQGAGQYTPPGSNQYTYALVAQQGTNSLGGGGGGGAYMSWITNTPDYFAFLLTEAQVLLLLAMQVALN